MGLVRRPLTQVQTRSMAVSPGQHHNNIDQSDDIVSGKYDLIGPPRSVSNLRPIKFAVPFNETDLQRQLRELRQETQKFNQGREEFIKNILETKYPDEPDKTTLSADEMS